MRQRPGRKGTVLFMDEHAGDWRQRIAASEVFMLLVTPEMLRSPRLWEHIAYAKQLGKPFRILLFDRTVLPDGIFAGVDDLEIFPCTTPEEAATYMQAVMQHGHGTLPPGHHG